MSQSLTTLEVNQSYPFSELTKETDSVYSKELVGKKSLVMLIN